MIGSTFVRIGQADKRRRYVQKSSASRPPGRPNIVQRERQDVRWQPALVLGAFHAIDPAIEHAAEQVSTRLAQAADNRGDTSGNDATIADSHSGECTKAILLLPT